MCGRWLDKGQDDGKIEREIFAKEEDGVASSPLVGYKVEVTTADRKGAGTDANVSMTLYGKKGDSGEVKLSSSGKNNFERGATDVFGFESEDLGDLTKLRIGHDGSGFGAGWFLDKVVVTNLKTNSKTFFLCGRWLDSGEDDKQTTRELPAQSEDGTTLIPLVKYEVTVLTGTLKGAGTDAEVFIVLHGPNGDSGRHILDTPGNNFERGQTDVFSFECVDLGPLSKIRIGHNGAGFGAGWFLEKVTVKNLNDNGVFEFPCNQWFDKGEGDGQIERDLILNGPSGPGATSYRISTATGSVKGAGTDANVFISIAGSLGKVDRYKLEGAKSNFERGKLDSFGLRTLDLGDLQKLTIGHDGKGFGDGWFLDKVFVTNEVSGQRWVFPCGQWLDKSEGDRKIERTLTPGDGNQTTYQVKVKTGNLKGAGTDANVFVQLTGDKSVSEALPLKFSLTNTNKFERGCLDVFTFDAPDVGKISKLKIWHDNAGLGASWYLDSVEVVNYGTLDDAFFLCQKWLDKKLDDGKIERELTPASKVGELEQEEFDEAEEDDSAPAQGSDKASDREALTKSKVTTMDDKILTLYVLAGRSLASKDSNGLSDPYVVAQLSNAKGEPCSKNSSQKTKVIKKTLNPTWENEILRMPANSTVKSLDISVWDEDMVGKDEFMGQISIPASDFTSGGKEKWYPLAQRKEKGGDKEEVTGEILIKFNLLQK
eukprot:TRINITY_DN133_c0_g1_i3.p1 TRINITY_DN133_c0_g1~~TRINITY_DN133_c0_g1_i3.p1  ORF type:complete len:710 (+),score=244.05 TRINITY_DN133_c0_g1_i3:779-2908(+)